MSAADQTLAVQQRMGIAPPVYGESVALRVRTAKAALTAADVAVMRGERERARSFANHALTEIHALRALLDMPGARRTRRAT